MNRIRPHLTYANTMATLAVFIALGGVGYATTSLPRNSVGTAQIRRHAVTASRLGRHAVTSASLASGAVTRSRLHSDAVTGGQVLDGSLTGRDLDLTKLGTVPSAGHASSSDRATTSDNSVRLDGLTGSQLTDHCPAGTVLDAGGCVETAPRTAPTAGVTSYVAASETCGASPLGVGRHLPTLADLASFQNHYTQSDPSDIEWTSDVANISGPDAILMNLSTGALSTASFGTTHKFRCVVPPSNG